MRCLSCLSVVLGLAALWTGQAATAASPVVPTSQLQDVLPLAAVQRLDLAPVDAAAARAEDAGREAAGLPPRFAMARPVDITPETHGTWETLPDPRFLLWRLRVTVPGALSLNLGCDRYRLPKGARLVLHPAGEKALEPAALESAREFTTFDNREHGQLWTPVVLGGELVVELTLPAESRHDYELRVASVNAGYRLFGEPVEAGEKAGSCNIDVVCPQGDPWRDEIDAVGVYTVNGVWTCSGAMINNSAANGTPYFLSAYHCGVTAANAASMVVYWNFQSPTCGQLGGGSLSQFQSGAIFRARYSSSDFQLVELEELPDPSWHVIYAGWDRSTADLAQAVGIHHPSTDEKSISFEYQATTTTSYYANTVPGDGTHIRITDWDLGTTEPGSSGSPLFDPAHRIVGQLHGGDAACGNDLSDWYGRLSTSWTGGGSAATRLRDWLDPLGTQPLNVDLYDPNLAGIDVTPAAGLTSQGPHGGPFAPASQAYLIENVEAYPIGFQVTADASWLAIAGGAGVLSPGQTASVTVSIGPGASALPNGNYVATVTFANLTDGLGSTTRPAALQVGEPEVIYSFPMDTNPVWSTQGLWAFGPPSGGGGQYGNPDPTMAHTGSNVYGYNLGGDYENNLPERHLTSTPLDCTGLEGVTLRFWRYLGVEQPAYDHAYLRVSVDGLNWTNVWQNTGTITDPAWTQVTYDISAIADDQPAVYLRWTMGTTDDSWQYCGWNLDDIEIVALRSVPPSFVDLAANLPALSGATVSWFEYDWDTDLDLMLLGLDNDLAPTTRIYGNDAGFFGDRGVALPDVGEGAIAWGDYDRDSWVDLLLAGRTMDGPIARIYRFDPWAGYADIGAGLPGVLEAAAAWGDYDNDGDLDLALAGTTTPAPTRTPIAKLYRNDGGGVFSPAADLPGVYDGALDWGDYDGDGDLDLALAGGTAGGPLTLVLRNDPGGFVPAGVSLPGVADGSVAWGDCDNDGDLDLLLAGQSTSGPIARIYANSGGVFADLGAGLPGIAGGNAAWGDYDNDGDLDLALAGTSAGGPLAAVYQNNGALWLDLQADLPAVSDAAVAWGHLDQDGDLDLVLAGDQGGTPITRLFRNDLNVANQPPAAPGRLSAGIVGNVMTMTWTAPADDHTPVAGLSYGIRVGTAPGAGDVVAPHASLPDGWRTFVAPGGIRTAAWSIALPPGQVNYYWSVQAIDGSFLGSSFASEQVVANLTGIDETDLPRAHALRAAVPNPFNPSTAIRFDLPAAERVELAIYDPMGRRVRLLLAEDRPAGSHEAHWDGRADDGRPVAAGVYICRIKAGEFGASRRLTLVK